MPLNWGGEGGGYKIVLLIKYINVHDVKYNWALTLNIHNNQKTKSSTVRWMVILQYDLPSKDWINTYYMLKGFLKARRTPKVWNEIKWTNEKMRWNAQDMSLSSYVSKANVDHTISGQGTATSTLEHSATTPRAEKGWKWLATILQDTSSAKITCS